MGEVIPDQHFVWVKVVRETTYHSIVVRGTEEEARLAGIEAAENYELAAQTGQTISIDPVVRPVREGHKMNWERDDIAYLRKQRDKSE